VKNCGDNVFAGIPVGADEASLFRTFLAAHDFGDHSRRAFVQDIRKFATRFYESNGEPFTIGRVTTRDITDFRNHLRRDRGQAVATVIANGVNEAERKAASDANAVQDACNLIPIVGCFRCHLIAMRDSGVCGDNLNNNPVAIAFVSKLNALCRVTHTREIAALIAIDRIQDGEAVEYEVIPL
jgi:hypothetical protein